MNWSSPSSGPTWRNSFSKSDLAERSLSYREIIHTMDILNRAVVSRVGTAAGTSVEMIGDALVDDSQRSGRCTGYDDRPVTARPSLPFVRSSSKPHPQQASRAAAWHEVSRSR